MKRLYILLALAAILASCSVDIDLDDSIKNPKGSDSDVNPRMVTEVISGSHGSTTKATIADTDGAFAWTKGDNLAVHVSSDTDHKYVVTSSGASDAAATAAFEVMYDEGYTRDAFAIFPSTIVAADAANYGQSGASLDVTLPGSYTLAQVTGATTPCPMIATNTAGTSWTFYQLCGLLRLTVSNIPANTKRLEINFDDKQVWGDFSIKSPVTPNSSTISTATDADHDIITITKNGSDVVIGESSLVLNIPLPTGTYSYITVTAFDALTAGNITHTMTQAFAYPAKLAVGTKIVSSFPGLFSVSSTKKVIFAQGNLQYLGNADGTGTWRFAEHQYDFMGDGPSSGTSFQGNVDYTSLGYNTYNTGSGSNPPTDGDKIAARDLFCWGTSGYNDKYPYMTSQTNTDYGNGYNNISGTYYDWGVYNAIYNPQTNKTYAPGMWRTLTMSEWNYLLNTRSTSSGIRYAKAIVNGVYGLIIVPDNWDTTIYALSSTNTTNSDYNSNNISAIDWWSKMEAAGCVFLPAGGSRSGTSVYGGSSGSYWSVTWNGSDYAYGLNFNSSNLSPSANQHRYIGEYVRLVRSADIPTKCLPIVVTTAVNGITDTSVVCGGNVVIDRGTNITACGICWDTLPNPTINSNHTTDGMDTGSFISNLIGLTAGTTYFVRAYATNAVGTAYGNEMAFITTGMSKNQFSVSNNQKVLFSPGNLQWSATNGGNTATTHTVAGNGTAAGTWRFAPNQWA